MTLEDEILEILQHNGNWMTLPKILKSLQEKVLGMDVLATLRRMERTQKIQHLPRKWKAIFEKL